MMPKGKHTPKARNMRDLQGGIDVVRSSGKKKVQRRQGGGSYLSLFIVCLLAIFSMTKNDMMTYRELKMGQRQEQGEADARGQKHEGPAGGADFMRENTEERKGQT
jgi:hypothetical protein